MLFNSYIFILLFLPLLLLGYYGLSRFINMTASRIFVIGMSLWFYAYLNPVCLLILLFSIVFNGTVSRILNRWEAADADRNMQRKRQLLLAAGITVDVVLIFYFKYYNFFVSSLNAVFSKDWNLQNLILPLGISFFTFQQIAYLVDSYRYETKEYTWLDYVQFVTYFPQISSGPIVLHTETIPQLKNSENYKINWDNMASGLHIFVMGLSKKVLIADALGRAVTWGYTTDAVLSSMDVLIVSLSYTLQLYFDFSGYCDMVVGIGRMMNISMPHNFDSPYQADSVPEFWKRWHMTLTRFLTKYIYFPLGGNRKGKCRQYLNIMVVFLISGIWHGANWTFVVWGLLHGIFNILNRIFMKTWNKLHEVTRWFITFAFVNTAWIIFRADSLQQAYILIRRLFGCESQVINPELLAEFKSFEFEFLENLLHLPRIDSVMPPFYMLLYLVGGLFICLNLKNNKDRIPKTDVISAIYTTLLLVYCIFSLAGITTFLYVNF